jgi:hypothetical protein
MISGLKGGTYEENLSEKRRHQADMLQTFKILKGHDRVKKDTWFQMAAQSERATRSSHGLLNLRPKPFRLEVRRHFFSIKSHMQ